MDDLGLCVNGKAASQERATTDPSLSCMRTMIGYRLAKCRSLSSGQVEGPLP